MMLIHLNTFNSVASDFIYSNFRLIVRSPANTPKDNQERLICNQENELITYKIQLISYDVNWKNTNNRFIVYTKGGKVNSSTSRTLVVPVRPEKECDVNHHSYDTVPIKQQLTIGKVKSTLTSV